ncbi:MAG: AAA family ATPase [Bacteroidales bacterium]|nr:AAA family ATPase [Bacteroidales bacterium]MBS3774318.1 AAA family ATPase [Bacteroidales bacterium]
MLIQRNIISQIEDHLERPEITLITGARQIGKTTILKMLLAKLHREGRQTLFFNLDFEKDFRYVE